MIQFQPSLLSNRGGLSLRLLWGLPEEGETLKRGNNSTGESHVQNVGMTGWYGAFTAMLSELIAHGMTPLLMHTEIYFEVPNLALIWEIPLLS